MDKITTLDQVNTKRVNFIYLHKTKNDLWPLCHIFKLWNFKYVPL